MTCVINKNLILSLAALCCLFSFANAFDGTPTQEITSNNFYSLAGRQDTVCMVTEGGVNITFGNTDSLSWFGFKSTAFSGALCFGNAAIVATMKSESKNVTGTVAVTSNPLWIYHFPSTKTDMQSVKNFTVIDSIFIRDTAKIKTLKNNADFSIVDAAWSMGAFWLACSDGGIVRLDIAANSLKAFLPGTPQSFLPSKFIDTSKIDLNKFPDTSKRVIALSIEDSSAASPALWVVTPSKLWRFSYQDSLWDSTETTLADTNAIFSRFQNAYAKKTSDTLSLFASIEIRKKKTPAVLDTLFCKYNINSKTWATSLDKAPLSVTFGENHDIYVNAQNLLNLYTDTALDGRLVVSGSNNWQAFQTRMSSATGGFIPENINGILYLPRPSGKPLLWIATSANVLPSVNNGLFYSLDEKSDEQNKKPFSYVHSDKKLTSGLKQTYAYPSILNSLNSSKAVFAYSLSKATKVTIRVYDWNMDLVKTVISSKDRPASNDQANGRSTNSREDYWDGTTSSGKRVAVGVYYYKITAQSGEQSFGKIIVAK